MNWNLEGAGRVSRRSPARRRMPAGAGAVLVVAGLAVASPAWTLTAPTLEEVKSATYTGFEGEGPITLSGGVWEGAPFVEGSAVRPRVTLVRDFLLAGDLDRDGNEEAVVFLAQGLGGSGEFMYVAIVDRKADGRVANVATASLGDQVQVRDAKIVKSRLILDVIQVGEPDARCCPGDWLTRTWTLDPKGLTEVPSRAPAKRLTPDALGDATWVLRSWDWDEPLADSVEVTLTLDGKVLTGFAGCNQFAAPWKTGDLPGDIRLGPIQSTLDPCPEPGAKVEKRYLDLVERARKFAFMATELLVTWEKGGAYGTMIFQRRAP